jgi:hypothetical protein
MMKKQSTFIALLSIAAVVLGLTLTAGDARAGATIVIQNNDGAGEGFNDPTPWTPTGGNPATTLGQARLNAFQYAANIWAQCLNSNVTIVVEAQMDPQFCDATSAVLGSAGTQTIHRNFSGAPFVQTWYPQALANALAGTDLSPTYADIGATFNSNLNGDPGCLGGMGWYYGYDESPGGDIDFVTVVLHEIGHGLGFQTFVNLASGAKYSGYNDMYMLNLEQVGATPPDYPSMTNAQRITASKSDPNLVWVGSSVTAEHSSIPITAGLNSGYMRAHGPNPQAPGSSVSHWSTAVSPNEVMEPSYTGANHDPSLALFLMEDIGWTLDQSCVCDPEVTTVTNVDTATVDWSSPIWEFRIEMENTGAYDAYNVTATMTTAPGWLTIVDGNCSYGVISAGTTDWGAPDSYTFDITSWPGGTFTVDIEISWVDVCGNPYVNGVRQEFDPDDLPTAAEGGPVAFNRLEQNVPNPFNPSTAIAYRIAGEEFVTLAIYDVSGKRIRTLVNRSQAAGPHEVEWDGLDDNGMRVSSGVYFYRITAGEFEQTRRMVLLK